MNEDKVWTLKIAFIGGDKRMAVCADEFCVKNKAETALFGFEGKCDIACATKCKNIEDCLRKANVAILPLPYSFDKKTVFAPFAEKEITLDSVLENVQDNTLILAGKLDEEFLKKVREKNKNIRCIDYFSREELQIYNAIPTCEGAICGALQNTEKTIYGSKILCSGYGRIGKILSKKLKYLGAEVFVSARKQSDFALIREEKMIPLDCRKNLCSEEFDVIFNTVPSLVFSENVLKNMKGHPLFIELASSPYGIDFAAASENGFKVILLSSIPGKMFPYTAGTIIEEAITNILHENGEIL